VVLAAVTAGSVTASNELLLPLTAEFEYWFLLEGGGKLQVRSHAEAALIEFEVAAFQPKDPAAGKAGIGISAFEVSSLAAARAGATAQLVALPA
jgi:hypothetical protein